jgi:hypothetical protein
MGRGEALSFDMGRGEALSLCAALPVTAQGSQPGWLR